MRGGGGGRDFDENLIYCGGVSQCGVRVALARRRAYRVRACVRVCVRARARACVSCVCACARACVGAVRVCQCVQDIRNARLIKPQAQSMQYPHNHVKGQVSPSLGVIFDTISVKAR